MLYVLGGASRSGKTLLARRAVAEKQIPYFPLDALFYSLVYGVPELGVRHENTLMERPHKMWALTKPCLNYFLKEERDYFVEGDSILPSQLNELTAEGKPIKCCFVGYTELDKDKKLALVREYHQGDADWTKDIPDEEMLAMIDEMIEFSKYLQEECATYDIKYFDVSYDFEGVRAETFEYLFNSQ
jgi:hypothetical protein